VRFVTYASRAGDDRVGVVHDGEVFGSEPGPSLLDLLDQGNLRQAGERIIGSPIERIPYAEATLRAPLEPRSLRDCVGFLQHLRNLSQAADMPVDDRHLQFPPFYFSNPAAVIGPYDDVPIAPDSAMFDGCSSPGGTLRSGALPGGWASGGVVFRRRVHGAGGRRLRKLPGARRGIRWVGGAGLV
jgi:hypothetical protein